MARSHATRIGSTRPSGRNTARPRTLIARPMPSSRAATRGRARARPARPGHAGVHAEQLALLGLPPPAEPSARRAAATTASAQAPSTRPTGPGRQVRKPQGPIGPSDERAQPVAGDDAQPGDERLEEPGPRHQRGRHAHRPEGEAEHAPGERQPPRAAASSRLGRRRDDVRLHRIRRHVLMGRGLGHLTSSSLGWAPDSQAVRMARRETARRGRVRCSAHPVGTTWRVAQRACRQRSREEPT